MGRNAVKPTINVWLNGDFFTFEDTSAIRERLDHQFQVDGSSIYWPDFQVEPAVYVYATIEVLRRPSTTRSNTSYPYQELEEKCGQLGLIGQLGLSLGTGFR
jgi:hypothetical protein